MLLRSIFKIVGLRKKKIYTVTIDNTNANDADIMILKNDFRLKKTFSIGGKLFHVRRCAHIIDFLV
jgi:hypothetical protein